MALKAFESRIAQGGSAPYCPDDKLLLPLESFS